MRAPHSARSTACKKNPGPFREIWPKTTIPTQQEFDIFGKKKKHQPSQSYLDKWHSTIHSPASVQLIHYDPLWSTHQLKGHAKKCAPRCCGSIVHQYLFSFLDPVMGGRMPPHMAHQRGDQVIHHWTHWLGDTFIQIYSMYIYTCILKDLHVCRIRDMYRSCCPKVHDEQGWQNSSHDKRVIDNCDKYWNTTYESTPNDWKCRR